jgi:hypothetical protein
MSNPGVKDRQFTPLTTSSPSSVVHGYKSSITPGIGSGFKSEIRKSILETPNSDGNITGISSLIPSCQNVVQNFQVDILPRGIRNFSGETSLFDIGDNFFSRFHSQNKTNCISFTSLGQSLTKIDFDNSKNALAFDNVQFEKTERIDTRIHKERYDHVSIHMGSVNNFSFKGSQLVSYSADSKTISSLKSLKFFKEATQNFSVVKSNELIKNAAEDRKKKICKTCNCRNSRCLKLYCECFKSKGFCSSKCSCKNCHNSQLKDAERKNKLTKLKNSISGKEASMTEILDEVPLARDRQIHKPLAACRCRRSGCLKNYCECFSNGSSCSENCNCRECKNHIGDSKSSEINV